jgi:hypothetical protein
MKAMQNCEYSWFTAGILSSSSICSSLNTPSLPYETLLQRLWFLAVKQLYINGSANHKFKTYSLKLWVTQITSFNNSMQQCSSWECNISVAIKNVPILYNLKVNDHIHNSSPMVSILSWVNPVQGLPSYFLQINFNIIYPSTLHVIYFLHIFPSNPGIHFSSLPCTP